MRVSGRFGAGIAHAHAVYSAGDVGVSAGSGWVRDTFCKPSSSPPLVLRGRVRVGVLWANRRSTPTPTLPLSTRGGGNSPQKVSRTGSGWKWYAAAMVLFALALLCKEQSAVLPGLFVLADLLWLGNWRRSIVRWIAIVLILAGYFLLRHLYLRNRCHPRRCLLDHPLQPFESLLYGLQTAISRLSIAYQPPINVWFSWPLAIFSVLALGALMFGIVKSGRTVVLAAIFWLGWFVLLQLPTAHIVAEQENTVFRTIRCPGGAGVSGDSRRRCLATPPRRMIGISVVAAIWLVVLGMISFNRGGFYANDMAFNSQWERTNPQSSVAHSGMGIVYEKRATSTRPSPNTKPPSPATARTGRPTKTWASFCCNAANTGRPNGTSAS